MKRIAQIISCLALAVTLVPAVLFFADKLELSQAKLWMLVGRPGLVRDRPLLDGAQSNRLTQAGVPQAFPQSMTSAIIVAAGQGTRMGPGVDKLFLELDGCPIVAHTWRRFDEAACIDEIVLVVRDGMQGAFRGTGGEARVQEDAFRLVAGGKERQDSVWNGLEALSPTAEIVAIQDAARPCTSPALIAATVAAARETGAAVAAQAVTDTIKESRRRQDHRAHPRPLAALGGANPADLPRGNHPARPGGGPAAGFAGHRRHGGLRTDRPARPAGGRHRAESQGHAPGGPALRRGAAARLASRPGVKAAGHRLSNRIRNPTTCGNSLSTRMPETRRSEGPLPHSCKPSLAAPYCLPDDA